MKLSFLILAHKNPKQLQRLIDYLLKNQCRVFLHIDKKSERLFNEFLKVNQGRERLHCFSLYKVYWGSFNQIEATFLLLREALKYPFDFVSLISGQDVPIKSFSDLSAFLTTHRDSSFLEFNKLPDPQNMEGEGGLERIKYHWYTDFGKTTAFFFNKFNVVLHAIQRITGLVKKWPEQIFAGPNWFTINNEAANYAATFVREQPGFYNRFKHTRLADEIILQTILLNNKNLSIHNRSLRFVDWQTGPEFPRIMRTQDENRLRDSTDFFARKFDETIDPAVISKLYDRI